MKGIIINGLGDDFPSVALGAGTIQKEDLYRYAKRNAQGEMRRIGWVGYTLRIEMKWNLLTRKQYDALVKKITAKSFDVQFPWQGSLWTKKFYAGNISATPFKLERTKNGVTNTPLYYRDISFPAILLGVIQ